MLVNALGVTKQTNFKRS